MKFICAANWKMNLSYKEAQDFLYELEKNKKIFLDSHPGMGLRSSLSIFPQAVHASLFHNIKNINWGAQDFYFESSGAFTGQNSPEVYKELGANMMLIGHSERRTLFAETDESISKKILKCEALNLIPMLCIGETLEERNANKTLDVLKKQLQAAFATQPKNLIVAYEPVWAIGTGQTASSEDVKNTHDFIKELVGQDTPVLYGGSVKPENAKELSSLKNVNGFLIGGASLKVQSFLAIYKNAIEK